MIDGSLPRLEGVPTKWVRDLPLPNRPEKTILLSHARNPWDLGDRENRMALKLNTASTDPPLGPPVPNWLPRPLPPDSVMSGRFCRVEPIDSSRHGEALYAAYSTDR